MKKKELLNQEISYVIAGMGHKDMLVIGDAGLPIPASTKRIDLALTKNIPTFLDTVRSVATELKVQTIIVAKETYEVSPKIVQSLESIFEGVEIKIVSHEELKELTCNARAVIRTGEFTPFANVILVSGVVF
jgi:D-ribose pyranase